MLVCEIVGACVCVIMCFCEGTEGIRGFQMLWNWTESREHACGKLNSSPEEKQQEFLNTDTSLYLRN